MKILHLKHQNIDYQRWDKVISDSRNSIVYPFSWFMDSVSPHWEALVTEDYNFVMPLPVKKKYGISYVIQPILTQQLGIFSPQIITEKIITHFIKHIPYISYQINLNEHNYTRLAQSYTNLILDLSLSYNHLSRNFSTNTNRNIKKATNHQLYIDRALDSAHFLHFLFKEEKKYPLPDKKITTSVILNGIMNHSIELIGVRNLSGTLIAVLGLLISGNRLIYLLPSSNTEGKEKSAMFYLINELIKTYAETDKILDFEGSRIEGIARFYQGFGAKPRSYYTIKRMRPHFFVR